eukprot:44105-Chlamydomonas_euryale.AAC.2
MTILHRGRASRVAFPAVWGCQVVCISSDWKWRAPFLVSGQEFLYFVASRIAYGHAEMTASVQQFAYFCP